MALAGLIFFLIWHCMVAFSTDPAQPVTTGSIDTKAELEHKWDFNVGTKDTSSYPFLVTKLQLSGAFPGFPRSAISSMSSVSRIRTRNSTSASLAPRSTLRLAIVLVSRPQEITTIFILFTLCMNMLEHV